MFFYRPRIPRTFLRNKIKLVYSLGRITEQFSNFVWKIEYFVLAINARNPSTVIGMVDRKSLGHVKLVITNPTLRNNNHSYNT